MVLSKQITQVVVLLLFVVVFFSFTNFTYAKQQDSSQAIRGTIDLRNWTTYETDNMIPLRGEWAFYWKQLLSPQQLNKTNTTPDYVMAPAEWSTLSLNGKQLGHYGYATYQLSIRLNRDMIGQPLALYVPASSTAYKVWLNDVEVASSGTVGVNFETEKPWTISKIVYLRPETTTLDLVVQISNFHQRSNGMWDAFLLGSVETISKEKNQDMIIQLLMTGSFFVMSIFYFFTYFFRRVNKMALYFSGVCLLFSIRLSVIDGDILHYFIHDSLFTLQIKLEYGSVSLASLLLIQYIKSIFPSESPPLITKLFTILFTVYSLFIFLTPVHVFTHTLSFLLTIITLVFTYHVLYVFRIAIVRKRPWAWSNLIASFIMMLTVINDGLYYISHISSTILAYIGFFIYYLVQIITMANHMSNAYNKLETVSNELSNLNMNLENKIYERTNELKTLNIELATSNEKLLQIEATRRKLLSNISHDLGTPMQSALGFVEMMLNGRIKDNQTHYLQIVYDKLQFINELSEDLIELTKMEENQILFHFTQIELKNFLTSISNRFALDFKEKWIHFEVHPPSNIDKSEKIYVNIDTFRMGQAFQNLLQNAMKFTGEKGCVEIYTDINKGSNEVIIRISDTGIGIDEKVLPEIFNRFMTEDTPRSTSNGGGRGLGLSIAKEIIHAHHGEIYVESTKGQGSTFFIKLPISIENLG